MSDFWSRRKQGVAREEKRAREAEVEASAAVDRAALEELSDEEALARLELPDPDTLSPGDDFARFLAREVPERIRRRALRTLWRSNPVLANVDGLVDHGEDYTDAATVPALLKTSYEVGRGLAAHVRRMDEALERIAAADGDAEPGGDEPAYPPVVEAPVSVVPPAGRPPAAPPAEVAAAGGEEATESPRSTATCDDPAPRARMRFTFETEETAA